MIGTEFLPGQGLGNQLFCYISARCLALDRGVNFGTVGRRHFGDMRDDGGGLSFIDLELGCDCRREDFQQVHSEATTRFFTSASKHDRTRGCDISLPDPMVQTIPDGTLLLGNLQSECYFDKHKDDIRDWLRVKSDFDSYEFSQDDLCIINMRGGEYVSSLELYLGRNYWLAGIQNMLKLNPSMRFMIVTDDVSAALRLLPEVPAFHFGIANDYITIHNARHLILSNSSFAFFPTFTSKTVKNVIAPKYWARHNVSDGYWSTGQNLYNGWTYQDRSGRLFTKEECVSEFDDYRSRTSIYSKQEDPEQNGLARQLICNVKSLFMRRR